MSEPERYEALLKALSSGRSEVLKFADSSGQGIEARACRAYALAVVGNADVAERGLAALNERATNERERMFVFVAMGEIAHQRGDYTTADQMFTAAAALASEMPPKTQGAAFADLAHARYLSARNRSASAKSKARAALSRATFESERALAAGI
jgi:hypothetical protein